jgi:hypothetical protein
MTRVLELALLDLAGRGWFGWRNALKRLNACLLVAAYDVGSARGERGSCPVEVADSSGLLGELVKVLDVWIQPVPGEVRA